MASVAFFIADAASGPLVVTPPGIDANDLNLAQIVTFSVLGGLVGVGLAVLCTRFARPARTFLIICMVSLMLYGITPFPTSEATSTAIWLNVIHIAAALPIVGLLTLWIANTTNISTPNAAT